MRNVLIIGNSGAARECHQLLTDCILNSPTLRYEIQFGGFFSYKGFNGDLGDLNSLFLGDLDGYVPKADDAFIIGVGSPALRREIFLAMKARGANFFNLISPWSYLPLDFKMGEGNIINLYCTFSGESSIGDGNYFNGSVRLGHNVNIGSFNFFAPSTTALGGATIGDCNLIAVQSVLLERSRIGSHNHINPASVIFKGCRNYCRMAGNPALKIADMEPESPA